jgi:Uma2 family endonuclease
VRIELDYDSNTLEVYYNFAMATILQTTAELMQIAPLHRFSSADYLEMIDKGVLGPEDHVELIDGVIVEKTESGIPPHRFSTTQYLEMIEKGVIGPNDRVELVEGIILDMSPAGSRHNQLLGQLTRIFAPLLDKVDLWIQGTLVVAEGQVYDPDVMLLRRKPEGYKLKLPVPVDVLLIVEAADSSFRRDHILKLPVYAAAGIREYWIADLDREQFLVYRDPKGSTYVTIETRQGDDIVSPLAAPDFSFAVRQAFD